MTREIYLKVYEDEFNTNLPKIDDLLERLRALDFILNECNFADSNVVGGTLTEMYDEICAKLKAIINKSEVEVFELNDKGKKIEYKLKNNEDEGRNK